jgi:serine/threonine protein kinase
MIAGMQTASTDIGKNRSGPSDAERWLDELAAGTCSLDDFIELVLRQEATDPEIAWEVLALIDQHFRRKLIDHETYTLLKARLHRHSLAVQGNETLALQPPAAAESVQMDALPPARPLDLPSLRIQDENPASAPDLFEASFHREVRGGDLLCGRYRIVEILRRTDWMTLAEAVDELKAALPGVRQRVALEILDESVAQDPLLLPRIGKVQTLSHPSITRVLDVEEDKGTLVLVTEFFGGISLRELLDRRTDWRVPLESARGIVGAVAAALIHAHARGIAHGDLTMDNILITDLGEVRLQGFDLRAQSHAVQPAADRIAFARLACQLLAGTPEGVTAPAPMSAPRRAPAGVTRAQWRALRDTLSGRAGSSEPDILAAFGGDGAAAGDPVLLQETGAGAPPRSRRHGTGWLAAGLVAAIIGGGIYLYLGGLPAADPELPASPASVAQAPSTQTAVESSTESTTAGDGLVAQRSPRDEAPPVAEAAPPVTEATVIAPPAQRQPPQPPPAPRRPSIDLASTFAWVETTEPVARIWVMRSGNLDREVTFRWWTETGTAQVDRDFRAIEPRFGVIPEGARGVELLVPLMPDPDRREPRTFYVKIDEPGPGADLGKRTLMQVAIVPPGYPAARDTRAAQNLAPTPP